MQVRRSRTAAVEARERRVQDQIDTAMVHNEEVCSCFSVPVWVLVSGGVCVVWACAHQDQAYV